jgi:hypothetical protein
MEGFSGIKKTKIMAFIGEWMEMETTTFSEMNHSQKNKYIFSLKSVFKKRHENKRESMAGQLDGWWGMTG